MAKTQMKQIRTLQSSERGQKICTSTHPGHRGSGRERAAELGRVPIRRKEGGRGRGKVVVAKAERRKAEEEGKGGKERRHGGRRRGVLPSSSLLRSVKENGSESEQHKTDNTKERGELGS